MGSLHAGKITSTAKEVCSNELPYKVEPPDNMAVSDTWETVPPADHFEPYCKPKRKYTKRSGFWTAKRKKAAARKAKKKTRKSK